MVKSPRAVRAEGGEIIYTIIKFRSNTLLSIIPVHIDECS